MNDPIQDLSPGVKIKKKRGRKPKSCKENVEIVKTNTIPGKRGRKPKNTIKEDTKNKQSVILDNNMIIHLPIKSNEIDQMLNVDYKSIKSPKPFEENNNFAYIETNYENNCETKIQNSLKTSDNNVKIINTNIEFYNNKNYNKLPIKTHQHCLWCSHSFNTSPIGLPVSRNENKFYVKGCFCSFNCALAYNFDKNYSNKWEYSALLHMLYKLIYNKYTRIIPAPSKELLNIYGGSLSIEEYRENLITNDKTYNLLHPPIVSVLPIIEEITNTSKMKENLYVPLNLESLNTSNLSIKSELTKNCNKSNSNQTLQSYMDLSVN